MATQDPTREDMLSTLANSDLDEFEQEEAIYWFAAHYHSGQSSNLYAALCASPFKPGAGAEEVDESNSAAYDLLVQTYGG